MSASPVIGAFALLELVLPVGPVTRLVTSAWDDGVPPADPLRVAAVTFAALVGVAVLGVAIAARLLRGEPGR